jgi:hypothetical protein
VEGLGHVGVVGKGVVARRGDPAAAVQDDFDEFVTRSSMASGASRSSAGVM